MARPEQQFRTRRHGARQRHPLLLAAGELVWIDAFVFRQAHESEQGLHARATLAFGEVAQTEADVVAGLQVRKQSKILEHHADPALLGRQRPAGMAHHLPAHADLAAPQDLETGNGAQQRGLAATARAQEAADAAGLQRERYLPHHGRAAVADFCVDDFEQLIHSGYGYGSDSGSGESPE